MNTYVLVAIIAIAAGVVVGSGIMYFIKAPTATKIQMIKNFLLYAVAQAEAALGSGTGQLKLAFVYNQFVEKLPQLAKLISFEKFSKLVDEVLDEFEEILKDNEAIKEIIKGEDING